MAVTLEDCEEMVAEVKKAGVLFGVCHVLRYYPHFKLIREMIQQGTIGQVSAAIKLHLYSFIYLAGPNLGHRYINLRIICLWCIANQHT